MANIAFIGLGNMGGPMAANLVKAGHKVVAFDLVEASRNQAKADGAAIADSAVAAVKGAEVVITMLPAGKHVLSVWTEVLPSMAKGSADHRLLDHRRRKRGAGPCAGGETWHRLGRCAGVRRHRRRQGRDADLHGRRRGQGVRRSQAGAGKDGQEDRALRRRRRRAGGQDLQQHDPRHFHDRGQRSLCARRKARAVASGAVRRRLDLVGTMLVADLLLSGAGAGADLAGEQRIQAGLCLGPDGEGPHAGAGCGQGGGCCDAARQARAGNLQGVRRRRKWRGRFLRDYPARPCNLAGK